MPTRRFAASRSRPSRSRLRRGAARAADHPVPVSPLRLTGPGGEGPGKGRRVVPLAADLESRSACALPMLAKVGAVGECNLPGSAIDSATPNVVHREPNVYKWPHDLGRSRTGEE